MQNLNEILKRLLQSDIDFIMVGGFAGVIHGASQVTQDLDICLVIDEKQLASLRQCFSDVQPKHRMLPNKPSFMDVPESHTGLKNIYLETDLGVLEIMSEVQGVGDLSRLKEKGIQVSLFGQQCWVMGLDDLIEVKKQLGRPKDKSLLEELLEIKKQKNS